jgi:hypothetical protein
VFKADLHRLAGIGMLRQGLLENSLEWRRILTGWAIHSFNNSKRGMICCRKVIDVLGETSSEEPEVD